MRYFTWYPVVTININLLILWKIFLNYVFIFKFKAYIASAVPVQEQGQARVYPRFVEIPDGEGNTHQVDLEAEPDLAAIDEYTRNPNNIAYLLFTRYSVHYDVIWIGIWYSHVFLLTTHLKSLLWYMLPDDSLTEKRPNSSAGVAQTVLY